MKQNQHRDWTKPKRKSDKSQKGNISGLFHTERKNAWKATNNLNQSWHGEVSQNLWCLCLHTVMCWGLVLLPHQDVKTVNSVLFSSVKFRNTQTKCSVGPMQSMFLTPFHICLSKCCCAIQWRNPRQQCSPLSLSLHTAKKERFVELKIVRQRSSANFWVKDLNSTF